MSEFNAFSKETIPAHGQFPIVFADHSTVDVKVNGKRFVLFNGGDLLEKGKGISPNSIWAIANDEEKRTLIKLDKFLLSEICGYLGGEDDNFTREQRARKDLLPIHDGDIRLIEADWSKEILPEPEKADDYLKKAIEIATDGYKKHVLYTSLHAKMEALAEADAKDEAKPNSMLHYLIIKAKAEAEAAEAAEAEAAEAAKAKAAAAAKAKETLLKQLTEWYATKKDYYIHQSHGMIWNQQQPFGGFSLDGVAQEYLKEDKYVEFVESLPGDKTDFYGCETRGLRDLVGNHIELYRADKQATPLKERDMSITGVHLPSKGDNRDLLKKIVGDTVSASHHTVSIVLGDTNITKSKAKNLELQDLAQKMSDATRKEVKIVMRKVEVSKMRTGGPLSNTQIYKSYLPVSEQDGMMVIVIGDVKIEYDKTHIVYEGTQASPAAALGLGEAEAEAEAGGGAAAAAAAAEAGGAAQGGGGRVRKARKSRKAKKHSKRARKGGSRKNKSKKQKKSRKN